MSYQGYVNATMRFEKQQEPVPDCSGDLIPVYEYKSTGQGQYGQAETVKIFKECITPEEKTKRNASKASANAAAADEKAKQYQRKMAEYVAQIEASLKAASEATTKQNIDAAVKSADDPEYFAKSIMPDFKTYVTSSSNVVSAARNEIQQLSAQIPQLRQQLNELKAASDKKDALMAQEREEANRQRAIKIYASAIANAADPTGSFNPVVESLTSTKVINNGSNLLFNFIQRLNGRVESPYNTMQIFGKKQFSSQQDKVIKAVQRLNDIFLIIDNYQWLHTLVAPALMKVFPMKGGFPRIERMLYENKDKAGNQLVKDYTPPKGQAGGRRRKTRHRNKNHRKQSRRSRK
jgi:hypothetical protein